MNKKANHSAESINILIFELNDKSTPLSGFITSTIFLHKKYIVEKVKRTYKNLKNT